MQVWEENFLRDQVSLYPLKQVFLLIQTEPLHGIVVPLQDTHVVRLKLVLPSLAG